MSKKDKEQKVEEITQDENIEKNPQNDPAEPQELEKELSVEEKLVEQVNQLQEKLLRLTAEYDNYRKRTLKEKAELIRNGGERAIVDLLPIIDDFELAIKHIDDSNDVQAIKEGVGLIYNKMGTYLKAQGVEAIETESQAFDDNQHEAIAMIPAPEENLKGMVIDCVKKGYKLNDKVIRYANVVVGE